MFILYWIVATFGCAAFSLGTDAIFFELVEAEHRTSAIAMKNIIAGPIGFLTTTALTPILSYIQDNGNKIFGIRLYYQQLFGFIALIILTISCVMFFNFAKTHNPVRQHGDEVKDRV
jgi:MFS family permease